MAANSDKGNRDARQAVPTRRPPGKRVRRLRTTWMTLIVAALAGAALAAALYVRARPAPYRPGEEHDGITRSLARDLPDEAPPPTFRDVTAESGLDEFVQFAGPRSSQLPEDMGSGAAWGDYDGDGDDDLFLVASGGALDLPVERRAPSLLFANLGDGRFRRAAELAPIHILGTGAAWGDANGDGRLDLAVSGYDSLRLYRNERAGFVRDTTLPELPGFWAGLAWSDFDRDGDLDLYVCGYVRYVEKDADRARATKQYGRAVPYTLNPASYPPERNLLFRNDGGTFSEVAEMLGVANPDGRSLSALWHDFDADGWPDLYLANDISDNVLYHNRGGTFEEISHAAFVADYRGAMGLAAGDWNRDGDDDLFITHWVAQENALYDSLRSELSMAPGSSEGGPVPLRFMDAADQRGLGQIALRVVGWGTEFVDVDADGWLDLVVANGSTFETDETPRRLQPEPDFLFWNRHGEYFHDLAPGSPALAAPHVSRGLAVADFDRDGDVDLLFVDHGEGVRLLANEMRRGEWLGVRLRDSPGPFGFADGATLVLEGAGPPQRRSVGGASYLSQSSRAAYFGLGDQARSLRLTVRWPDGRQTTHENLAAGAVWEFSRDDPAPRRATAPLPAAAVDDPPTEQERRKRLVAFWDKQRAAMRAVKQDNDPERAVSLFREALALDPGHEDSLYYLALCLEELGDRDGARAALEKLVGVDPQSHRGFKQLGKLLALSAGSPAELEPAARALQRATEINPEETGALLVLGEIAVLQGDTATAAQRLEWVGRTNPRAVGAFFLRGYLAWAEGDVSAARRLLGQAAAARGEEFKPAGATAEGDVERRMHRSDSPLSGFWEAWDGRSDDPSRTFADLHARVGR